MKEFVKDESGAVSVDYVVLCAGLIGLGVIVMNEVAVGANNLGMEISWELGGNQSTSVYPHSSSHIGDVTKTEYYDSSGELVYYTETYATNGTEGSMYEDTYTADGTLTDRTETYNNPYSTTDYTYTTYYESGDPQTKTSYYSADHEDIPNGTAVREFDDGSDQPTTTTYYNADGQEVDRDGNVL